MILHLLNNPLFKEPIAEILSPETKSVLPTTLALHVRKLGGIGMEDIEINAPETGGQAISLEALLDLKRRNPTPRAGAGETNLPTYANLEFSNRIEVADLKGMRNDIGRFAREHPRAVNWIACYFPGYSKDGREAVVQAWVGPEVGWCTLTARLERVDSKWEVQWCKFHYSPT